MAQHKLEITDIEEEFELIAIHSQLEDYKLAFYLNNVLLLKLCRSAEGILQKVGKNEFAFSRYQYEDEQLQQYWSLSENKKAIINSSVSGGLFAGLQVEQTKWFYLIPELKKADYVLKIEGSLLEDELEKLVREIIKINNVQTAYAVPVTEIKSKNNLIF